MTEEDYQEYAEKTGVEFNPLPIKLQDRIWDRYQGMPGRKKLYRETVVLCLAAANGVNGNPRLALKRLAYKFDDFSFMHDVVGICNHMNTSTGKITGHFLPRCAISEKETDE